MNAKTTNKEFNIDNMVEKWLLPHQQRMNDTSYGVHVITSLIEKSKDLPVYDYDLSYIDLSRDTWDYDSREGFIMHMKACNNADLTKPIIVAHNGQILDGMHRVCKAIELGMKTLPAVRFTELPTADYYK